MTALTVVAFILIFTINSNIGNIVDIILAFIIQLLVVNLLESF